MKPTIRRIKSCKGKVSFTNVRAALACAEKHGQRVYECPVCFCFHCTSKPDLKDEFVPIEKYRNVLAENERLQKRCTKYRKRYGNINKLRHSLDVTVKRLKKKLAQYEECRKEDSVSNP